jgi:hypothetical protein
VPDVVDEALDNQKRNIGTRTGRAFEAWVAIARASGIEKHGALLAWLKAEHGLGHGDANLIALTARRPDPEDTIYAGPKAGLRPFHEQVVALAQGLGEDVAVAPKQAYVSIRRTRQFATVGPASGGRLELGLNLKGVTPEGRLEPATGMCTHRVRLISPDDFDAEVQGWLREAYERA